MGSSRRDFFEGSFYEKPNAGPVSAGHAGCTVGANSTAPPPRYSSRGPVGSLDPGSHEVKYCVGALGLRGVARHARSASPSLPARCPRISPCLESDRELGSARHVRKRAPPRVPNRPRLNPYTARNDGSNDGGSHGPRGRKVRVGEPCRVQGSADPRHRSHREAQVSTTGELGTLSGASFGARRASSPRSLPASPAPRPRAPQLFQAVQQFRESPPSPEPARLPCPSPSTDRGSAPPW